MKQSDQSSDSRSAQALGAGHQSIPKRTPRILIAEDHPTERDYLKTVLNYAGYEVLEAADGEAALDIARRQHPDLVVSDILMPKLDGLEFVRQMRSDPETATIRIIIWSASFKQSEAQIMAEALGVARYLKKPVEPDTLLFTVKETLNAPPPPRVLPAVLNKLEEAHQRLIGDQLYRKSLELEEELATRQQIENALRESERRLAGLIDSAMDAIISIDVKQRITIFNKAAQTMFRCLAYEAIGSPLERFIPERFRADHREYVRHFAESGTTSRAMGQAQPVWGLRADGEEFPIDASISKVYVEGHWQLTVILRDITERQRTEQALQDSERRLTMALAAGRSALWEMNVVTGVVNDLGQLGVLLGYSPGEFTTLADWVAVIHEDDRSAISEAMSDVIQGKRDSYRIELRVRAKDGRWRWILGQGIAAERDAQGQAVRIVGTSTDIHDRKRMEEQLKESEAKYRTLFSHMTEGFMLGEPILDDQGKPVDMRYLEVNKAFHQQTGVPKGIEGRPVREYLPQIEQYWIDRFSAVALTGRADQFDAYNIDTGRSYGVYVFSPSAGHFAVLGRDITQQKRMERALQENEGYLRHLIATLPGMVWTTTIDGAVDFVSQQWLDYTGTTQDSQLGSGFLECVHPQDRDTLIRIWRECVESQLAFKMEYRLRRHDGTYRWFNSRGTPILDQNGQLIRWLGIVTDIDDLKRAQAALQESEEVLQATVEQAAVGICHVSPEGYFIRANRKLCDMLGYSAEELRQKHIAEVTYPPDRDIGLDDFRRSIRGEIPTFSVEKRYQDRNGNVLWVRITAASVRDPQTGRTRFNVAIIEDFTERKHWEMALQESEQRLALALEASNALVWELKEDETVHGTHELAIFLGYGPGELRTLTDWLSLIHEDDRTDCSQVIQELFQGKRKDYRREWRIRTKDGRWHWFVSHAVVAEHDAQGRVVRIVGTYTNIDERKQVELDLQDSERRLSLALAAGNSAVWEMEVATGVITGGDDLFTMYGYGPGELKTLADWSALVHETDRTGISEKINDAIQGKTGGYSFEARLRSKDGTWCWNLSEGIVTERDAEGRALRLVGTHSNIDDRKRTEEALRYERSRLQAILDNAPILISVKDTESRMVLANQAIFETVKVPPPEEFIGRSVFESFPQEVAEALWANDLAAMRADVPIRAEEVVQHRDGTWHTYLTSKFPVHEVETNALMGICAISADITDLKAAQAEIQRLNAELEARVQERTAELQRANEALLHTNLELQHFARATAHDLQTPLRSIAGFAQLLQREIQGGEAGKAEELASIVIDNTKRLQTLIDNLLAYTRLEAQGLPFKPVDLRDVADEVVTSLAVLIQETDAETRCEYLPTLPVDRNQIAQVLQNLIENGIKYNRSRPPKVSIASEFQDDEWVFSVADNGIGIDPKQHERIFEIFRRLHTYHQVPGTGIGLALCRRIIERHGGRIWVESSPGAGSTFYFTLPVRDIETTTGTQ